MNKKRLTDDQGLKMELAGVMCRLSSSVSILAGNLVVSIEVQQGEIGTMAVKDEVDHTPPRALTNASAFFVRDEHSQRQKIGGKGSFLQVL